jgi:hypothetical protein
MRTIRFARLALLLGAVVAIGALNVVDGVIGRAAAKGEKDGDGIRYAKSYAEAWKEARARNALIFALFHKDN